MARHVSPRGAGFGGGARVRVCVGHRVRREGGAGQLQQGEGHPEQTLLTKAIVLYSVYCTVLCLVHRSVREMAVRYTSILEKAERRRQ